MDSVLSFGFFPQEFLLWSTTSKTLFSLSALLLVYLTFNFVKENKRNLPPGPFGLPIVGYIPFLTKNVYLQFIELGKKYGEVFSLQLGSQLVVVLNTADAIKEGLPKYELLGRPPQNGFTILGTISPFFEYGNDRWEEHRKLVVRVMKDLGFGKSKIEEQIQDEICRFVDALASHTGEPFDIYPLVSDSMSNNICSLLFGERYDYEGAERNTLVENLRKTGRLFSQASIHIYFPWLRKLPFFQKFMNLEKELRAYNDSGDIFNKKIQQHVDTLDPKHPRDFIDRYLVEMNRKNEANLTTTLSNGALFASISDIYFASIFTTRAVVLWCLYVAAAFPDAQERIRQELDNAVGPDRRPGYSDKERMPYTHAFYMEVMRWKSVGPLNLMRYANEDTTVKGYHIPKGTTVLANFWNAHHDPEVWLEPDVFRPERFLSEDGLSFKKSTNFMQFSLGKRACPGEEMAHVEIFLFLVSILQKFRLSFPQGFKPTYEAECILIYGVKPYKIQLTPLN